MQIFMFITLEKMCIDIQSHLNARAKFVNMFLKEKTIHVTVNRVLEKRFSNLLHQNVELS